MDVTKKNPDPCFVFFSCDNDETAVFSVCTQSGNRDNEMMTKAKVLSFYFFLYLFSVCVCGACLDDRRGTEATTADKSVVVVVAATIL